MVALFRKGRVQELREAFIRDRFKEPTCFQNRNIENWIASERAKEELPRQEASDEMVAQNPINRHFQPRVHSLDRQGWQRVINNPGMVVEMTKAGALEIILECLKHCDQKELMTNTRSFLAGIGRESNAFLELPGDVINCILYRGDMVVLPSGERQWVIVFPSDGRKTRKHCYTMVKSLASGRYCVTHGIDAKDALLVLYNPWISGRPLNNAALASLCNTLEVVVNQQRAIAQEGFDSAVAVSNNAEKLVHAEQVFTFGDGSAAQRYDLSHVRHEKIVRSKAMERREMPDGEAEKDRLLALGDKIAASIPVQLLIVCQKTNKRFFFVHE